MCRFTVIRVFFLMSVFVWCALPVLGQEEEDLSYRERREMAKKHIRDLKEGVLIVRLPSQQNKIETLQELLDGGKLDAKGEKRIKERLEGTKAKTESFNKNFIAAFYENYRFSDFLFILDTASVHLKAGNHQGIFLNKNLEPAPELSLGDRPYYVLRFGSTRSGSGQSVEAMVLMDDNFRDLQPPFPYYVRINNFNAVMGGLFPKPKQEQKNARRLVENLQANLAGFARYFE